LRRDRSSWVTAAGIATAAVVGAACMDDEEARDGADEAAP
jgi:hypothetical protein